MNLSDKLSELEKLCEAATPGPWVKANQVDEGEIACYEVSAGEDGDLICCLLDANVEKNQEFIAASRTALPLLIEIIKIQTKALETLASIGVRFQGTGSIFNPKTREWDVVDRWDSGFVGPAKQALSEVEELVKGKGKE